jgi:BlaI family transcriptional regulator, penicillinase repressor
MVLVAFNGEMVAMTKMKLELSAAEWEIMQVVWERGEPVTVRQVVDAAYPRGEKAYTTVQTFMNIMTEKGILKKKKAGAINMYTAGVSKDKYFRRSISTLATHMFDGSVSAMASYLVNTNKFSPDEIAALRKLLDERGGTKK